MRHHNVLPLLCAAIILLILSCSGASSSPVLPPTDSPSVTNSPQSHPVDNAHLWGYWDIGIDPSNGAIDIVELRYAEFTANVTMFIQPPAGKTSNMSIQIVDMSGFPDDGRIDIRVSLQHPFPGLDFYTGFDVMGVFIHDGDTVSAWDENIFYPRTEEVGRLLNADGYTRWYNPSEFTAPGILGYTEGALGTPGIKFTATINPYKYFCDGLSASEDISEFLHEPGNIEDRGLFSTTAANSRLYELQFPFLGAEPYLTFQYAVVANWEPSDPEPPDNIPGDFPPEANAHEPFHLFIQDAGSDLWYEDGGGGGGVRIQAELFDWTAADNPDGILGEFSRVIFESPNAEIPDDYYVTYPEDFIDYIQPGTAISSIAMIELDGIVPAGADDLEFLVTIESREGDTYDQGFGVPVPEAALARYFTFTLPVNGDNPCSNFWITSADPDPAQPGEVYSDFTVYGVNFQDGPNLAVEVLDGNIVIVEGENETWIDSGTITCEMDFTYVNPGLFTLRVVNGCEPVSYAVMDYYVELACDDFTVISADPSYALEGEVLYDVTVTGENFQDGPNLAVDIVDGDIEIVNGTNVTYLDSESIECDLDFTGVSADSYELRVTNGCEPVSYDTIPFPVYEDEPGIKNEPLVGTPKDIGVRESDGRPLIITSLGKPYLYAADYSSYQNTGLTAPAFDRLDCLDSGYGYVVAGPFADFNGHGINPCYIKLNTPGGVYMTGIVSYSSDDYNYGAIDVVELNTSSINDWMIVFCWVQEYASSNYFLSSTIKNSSSNWSNVYEDFSLMGSGDGTISHTACKGAHVSVDNDDGSYDAWVYILEASPEFVIERFDYGWDGASQTIVHDLTICDGTQGNGPYQLNNPQDISGDITDNIYVLDLLSTGQRVIKAWDKNGNYLGQFGDNSSISGVPLRLDVDLGDGEVHVIHSDGVSVFTPAELPF